MNEIIIRNVLEKDIPQIAEIEKNSFTDPWTENSLLSQISEQFGIFLIAEKHGEIIGYIIGSCYGENAFIEKIAVKNSARKQGAGKALINKFISEISGNAKQISLEVRESNFSAQALYFSVGFEASCVRKNLYEFPKENGIVMIKEL